MKKKVLIVNPPSSDKTVNRDMAGGLGYSAGERVVLPPLDLLSIAATLRNIGWRVRFIDALVENFEYCKVDVIIGSLALPTLKEDVEFYRKIKNRHPKTLVIIKTGINYGQILKKILIDSRADKIIFGEPDLNIVTILNSKAKIINAGKIDEIDLLPIPARDLSKIKKYKYGLLPGVITTMQTSRGCPFECGYYCPYPLVQGKRWRAMSPARVIKEISEVKRLRINNILFRDATFTLDMNRAQEICRLIIQNNIKIRWWCETRINVLNEELLKKMKAAGCQGMNVGIETLDEELIEKVGKPGVSVEKIIKITQEAQKLHIKLHFLMIIGLPDDSVKTLFKTFERLVEIRPETVGFTVITPYPGTELFNDAKRAGLIRDFEWSKFNGQDINMRTKCLSVGEIRLAKFLLMGTSYCLRKQNDLGIKIIGLTFKLWSKIKGY